MKTRQLRVQMSLDLVAPDEVQYVKQFSEELARWAPKRAWTRLLHQLAMLHVEPVGECSCSDPRELNDWLHKNHGAYNAAVRAAIIAAGARAGMLKALDRDLAGPVDESGFGRVVRRDRAELLRDFLHEEPGMRWFICAVESPMRIVEEGAV